MATTAGGGSNGGALNMQSTGASGTPISPSASPTTPTLQQLMTTNPGAGTFAAATGTAFSAGTAPTANASLASPMATITNGQINPQDSTNAASQIDAITNANSPYIAQAEQQGLLSAASRGLENSSIGAGASEAAAVQAAAPLAEQNASEASSGMLQNAQLATNANEFNASQALTANTQNAQLAQQEEQANQQNTQAAAASNASAENAMTQQTMQLNEAVNQQYLSGTQAQSLAQIQGQYNELIATNNSASAMYDSYMTAIGSVMNNQNIAPSRVADSTTALQSMLESGLAVVNAINGGSTGTVSTAPTSATPASATGSLAAVAAATAPNVAVSNQGNDFTTTAPKATTTTTPAKTTTPAAPATTKVPTGTENMQTGVITPPPPGDSFNYVTGFG